MKQAENTHALSALRGACTAVALILAVGCGDDGSSGSDTTPVKDSGSPVVQTKDAGKADAGTPPGPVETGDVTNGKKLALVCTACHGTNLAGAGYYPNITPDQTNGIGSWTDDEISNAFNNGIDQDGSMLCAEMTPYNFDDSDTADLLAYLRSIPANAKKITAECPGK